MEYTLKELLNDILNWYDVHRIPSKAQLSEYVYFACKDGLIEQDDKEALSKYIKNHTLDELIGE